MDNAALADYFSLLSKLMEINGENAFRAKTYSIAAFQLEKLPGPITEIPRAQWPGLRGIGDSVARKIDEILQTGQLSALTELLAATPPGVTEMLQIKGLGPKKIHTIWKEMGIESIGELRYACHENRLLLYKGFGAKTQQNIEEAIGFYLQHQGHFLYAELEAFFPSIDSYLKKTLGEKNVCVTGGYRRQELTHEELAFVISLPSEKVKPVFQTAQPPELLEENTAGLVYKLKNGLKLRLYTGEQPAAATLFRTTGSPEFVEVFDRLFPAVSPDAAETGDDRSVFAAAGIHYIPPFLRESTDILEKARQPLPRLIEPGDIRGIIHSHSTWSDGSHSLEEMAAAAQQQGYEYLVISDHSQSAAYAGGLKPDRIAEQHRLVDKLNQQSPGFRIFKSIESDILGDGRLDYSDDVLASFDLVIASVHSTLKMTEEKAMQRLLRAVENPYTRILGHPTGRLLLSRNGYPVDHRRLIDACAANQVVIEINAHPRRLDLDWRWISYAMEKGVLLSVNPDAHAIEGFADTRYGVLAAQKGGLTKEYNLSSFTRKEFEEWLKSK